MNKMLSVFVCAILLLPLFSNIVLADEIDEAFEGCEDVKWWELFDKIKCSWGVSLLGWLNELIADIMEPLLNYKIDKDGNDKLNNFFKTVAYSGLSLMIVYSAYLFAFAGSIGDDAIVTRSKAKSQFIKAVFFGFALLIVPFILEILMVDIVGSLVKGIIQTGGAAAGAFGLASGILLYFAVTSAAFPITWTLGLGLILLFVAALVVRIIMLYFYFTIMPLILFLYFFTPTKKFGQGMMQATIVNIFFPVVWALILIIASSLALTANSIAGFIGGFILSLFSILALPICAVLYFKYGAPTFVNAITSGVGGAAKVGIGARSVAKGVGRTKTYDRVQGRVNERLEKLRVPSTFRLPETRDITYEKLKQTYGDNLRRMNTSELISSYNKAQREMEMETKFKEGPKHYKMAEAIVTSQGAHGLDTHLTTRAKKELRHEFGSSWQLKSKSEQLGLIKGKKETYLMPKIMRREIRKGRRTLFNYTADKLMDIKDSGEVNSRLKRIRDSGKSNEYFNYAVKQHPKISKGVRLMNQGHNMRRPKDNRHRDVINATELLKEIPNREFVKSLEGFDHFDKTGELLKHYGRKHKATKSKKFSKKSPRKVKHNEKRKIKL